MRRMLLLVFMLCISCAPQIDAIRFRRTIQVRIVLNTYTFMAGTTLIADRRSESGPVFCGPGQINGGSTVVCVGVEGSKALLFGPRDRHVVPADTFERLKIKI
jgi:hypothetical protein